jgi:hypothetical protein
VVSNSQAFGAGEPWRGQNLSIKCKSYALGPMVKPLYRSVFREAGCKGERGDLIIN